MPPIFDAGIYVGTNLGLKVFLGSTLVWEPSGGGGLPAIGEAFEGGYFVGPVSYNLDGIATHALIVGDSTTAARGSGYVTSTGLTWQVNTTTYYPGLSTSDGAANLALMETNGLSNFPAGQWCGDLTSEGFSDWYLPARFELMAAYINLKPSTTLNVTSTGTNSLIIPERTIDYTTTDPARTTVAIFQSGGAQAFSTVRHWTSTSPSTSGANSSNMSTGALETTRSKLNTDAVRAFRRVAL